MRAIQVLIRRDQQDWIHALPEEFNISEFVREKLDELIKTNTQKQERGNHKRDNGKRE